MRMMVSPMKLTVPSAAPVQLSLSANPDHLKTERSVNNLRPCGENCQISSKFSSLMVMTKVHLSSQRSNTRSQVLSIKDRRNGIGKPVFKTCLPWKWTNFYCCLTWSVCSWCFSWCVATGSLSSQLGQSVMAAFSPPRLFCRLAGRGAFFCGFPLRWVLYIDLSLTRRVNVHDATPSLQGGFSLWMWAPMRCIVFSFLFCPVASEQPIHVGARDSVSEGCWPDLFQDIPDQSCHMLTGGAHVLGLACRSFR